MPVMDKDVEELLRYIITNVNQSYEEQDIFKIGRDRNETFGSFAAEDWVLREDENVCQLMTRPLSNRDAAVGYLNRISVYLNQLDIKVGLFDSTKEPGKVRVVILAGDSESVPLNGKIKRTPLPREKAFEIRSGVEGMNNLSVHQSDAYEVLSVEGKHSITFINRSETAVGVAIPAGNPILRARSPNTHFYALTGKGLEEFNSIYKDKAGKSDKQKERSSATSKPFLSFLFKTPNATAKSATFFTPQQTQTAATPSEIEPKSPTNTKHRRN